MQDICLVLRVAEKPAESPVNKGLQYVDVDYGHGQRQISCLQYALQATPDCKLQTSLLASNQSVPARA